VARLAEFKGGERLLGFRGYMGSRKLNADGVSRARNRAKRSLSTEQRIYGQVSQLQINARRASRAT
jgi:hypothetical protein